MQNIKDLIGGKINSGAYKGASLLINDLNNYGVDTKILCEKHSPVILNHARKILDKIPKLFYPNREESSFSTGLTGYNFLNHPLYKKADIIHLNWVNNGFFNINLGNNKFKSSEILDGKKILSEITANFDKIERKNFNDKIIFMIENSILDFSYHPIVDYKKYYSVQTN